MSDQTQETFEQKLSRIDAIVQELEGSNISLERAVQLFKEGKSLARECEGLLKSAQEEVDKAMGESQA